MSRHFCVGLTGGIGSGKSTVSGMFEELGVNIIDADVITHELQAIGQPAYIEIVKQFDTEVIGGDRELNRSYLRKLIFTDPELKTKLENIVHPLVHSEINRRIMANNHPYSMVSIPLLSEHTAGYNFDRILVVDIPEDLQISRASSRDGTSRDEIAKILDAQLSRQRRLTMADDVIVNDGTKADLLMQVENLHGKYLQLAING